MSFDDFDIVEILLIGIMIFVLLFVPFALYASYKGEQQMIAKCTPNPSTFECQLFLAKQGRASIQGAAISGAVVGSIVANGNRN